MSAGMIGNAVPTLKLSPCREFQTGAAGCAFKAALVDGEFKTAEDVAVFLATFTVLPCGCRNLGVRR